MNDDPTDDRMIGSFARKKVQKWNINDDHHQSIIDNHDDHDHRSQSIMIVIPWKGVILEDEEIEVGHFGR